MPKTEPFNKYSREYDQWFERNSKLYQAELEAVRRLMPSNPSNALEVGVGSGKFAAPLGIKTGVEPAQNMAMQAKSLGIRVCSGVAENLPFSGQEFDLVLMVTTICFVDDLRQSFREAFRVLKPEGCLLVGFVDKDSPLGRRYRQKKEQSKFYQQAEFYSTPEVLQHLGPAGFSITASRQTLLPGKSPATIIPGYGQGSFVVVKATPQV